jgi:ankyrin repeat protein
MQLKETLDEKVLLDTAQWGHIQIIQLLIMRGVNLNARGSFGETALMMASYWGHKDIVELLLKENVDVNLQDNGGATALMMAVVEKEDLYSITGGGNRLETVSMLLAAGALCNIRDNDNKTALDYARETGNKNVVALLERIGAAAGGR